MQVAQRDWLRKNIGFYQHQDLLLSDVEAVMLAFPRELLLKTDTFIHDDGRSFLLVCIHGTIPVLYKGTQYHIPLSAWLPHSYPMAAPMIFVTPTSSMAVRESNHVDKSGKIYHTYLNEWPAQTESARIRHFLSILQEIFSIECPVYAKPAQSSPHLQQHPPPPQHSSSTGNIPTHHLHTLSNTQQHQQRQYSADFASSNLRHSNTITGSSSTNSKPSSPITVQQQQTTSQPDPSTLKLNNCKRSLAQKLSTALSEMQAKSPLDMDRFMTDNRALNDNASNLGEIILKYKDLEKRADLNVYVLAKSIASIKEMINSFEKEADLSPDGIVSGSSVLHEQSIEVAAAEEALGDCIYNVGSAFGNGKLDSTTFLKIVRDLSRQRFKKIYLKEKIARKRMF